MSSALHRSLLAFIVLLASSCALACVEDPQVATGDVCEEAARHREVCTGDYVTPPMCDEAGAAAAEHILSLDCSQLTMLEVPGKADGAFCDWFGLGCTPDEAIFDGPACSTDTDCAVGFCVEQRCFEGVTSEAFQQTLDEWTATTEERGSYTHLLVDNVETRALRRELIESAERSLHFSAFIIQDDEIGAEMSELFSAAARRGVEVRVVVDATTQYTFSTYERLWEMRDAGVEIMVFNPVTEWSLLRMSEPLTINDRLHDKLLIADGEQAIMGGRNIGDEYLLEGRWRDTDVYISGPGVAGVQRLFLHIWDKISTLESKAGCPSQEDYGLHCPDDVLLSNNPAYFPALAETGTAYTRAINSDPFIQDTPLGYFTTLALVRGAQRSITIANSYFVPPRRLRKHLKEAVARGVKVRVLSNSLSSTDAFWMYYASINYYEELISAGVEIHQYMGEETMHAKTMLIDDELALVGSYNLDPRSAVDNSETILLIREGDAVEELRQAMEADFAYSTEAGYDFSLADKAKALSFRITEPLL